MLNISIEEENRYAQLQVFALDFARLGKVDDLENVISKSSNTSTSTQSRDRTNLFTVSRALAGGQVVGGNSNNSGNEYHFDIN